MSNFGEGILNVFGCHVRVSRRPGCADFAESKPVGRLARRGVGELECLGILLSAGSRKQVNMQRLSESSGSHSSSFVEWSSLPVSVGAPRFEVLIRIILIDQS